MAAQHTTVQTCLLLCAAQQGSAALVLLLLLAAAPFLCFCWYSWHSALCHAFQAFLWQAAPQKRTCNNPAQHCSANRRHYMTLCECCTPVHDSADHEACSTKDAAANALP
jgi:hypothetical protein